MTDYAPQHRWLERLIAHDTTSSKSNLGLIDDVDEYLQSHGAQTYRVYNEARDKANLYALIGPNVEGGVILSGHTDVVPVAGQDWRTDPFRVTEKDGLLYGRGTCDMKAFSAIGLSLVPEMIDADLKRPVIFALSYDEEVGCLGAPHMIAEIKDRLPAPSAVIVGEPTMMKVIDGHKGIASFKVKVTGHTTHSSQTDRGVSAVETAAQLIVKLSAMRAQREAAADPESPFTPPYSTMTVNVVEGGTQLNIMAGECVFDFDVRVIPGETARDIFEEFSAYTQDIEGAIRARAADCRIAVEQMTDAPSFHPQADNAATDLAKALSGHNSTDVVAYCTEAGQFQEAGFSTVVCGPGSIDQAHQANEYLSIDQLEQGTLFLRKLIARLAA